jgi:hypothetical protein
LNLGTPQWLVRTLAPPEVGRWSLSLLPGQFVTGGFPVVADEKESASECGLIPGLGGEGGDGSELAEGVGGGGAEVDGATFVLDEQEAADDEGLAGT